MKIIIHKWVKILLHLIYTLTVVYYLTKLLKAIYPVEDYLFEYIIFGLISTIYGRLLGTMYRVYWDSDE